MAHAASASCLRLPPLWGQQYLLRRAYSYFRFPPLLHSPANLPRSISLHSHPHLPWERPCQPGNHIHTWRDLLLPNGWDTHVELEHIDKGVPKQSGIATSTFAPPAFSFSRLPSEVHLVKDLPLRMQEHLCQTLDQNCADQASRTTFTSKRGFGFTPEGALETLRHYCSILHFPVRYEHGAFVVGDGYSLLVNTIHDALMETEEMLAFTRKEQTTCGTVITDQAYLLGNKVKILCEVKSPVVFDQFIGELMEQLREKSPLRLRYSYKSSPSKLRGYEAILGRLAYHASDDEPQARWAVVYSGLNYIVIYIPRDVDGLIFHCTPVMTLCLERGKQQDTPQSSPIPIWSLLIYMLLSEKLNLHDKILRENLGLPHPKGDQSLSDLKSGKQRLRQSGTVEMTEGAYEQLSYAGKLTEVPGSIVVQCLDGLPMELTRIDTLPSQHAENHCPFIHLDRNFGGGWSSVYASSKSHIVVKFGVVPKKDKAEVERLLINEKNAYHKLSRISGWVVPRFYGEYEWYGGRALVFSDGGQPLSDLEGFTSLSLIERLILFAELFSIHYYGVDHWDFEPRNVLRKTWPYSLKVIDFGFSDADHKCPGWRECGELEDAWHALRLDKLTFKSHPWFNNWVPGKIIPVVTSILFLITFIFIRLYWE